MNAYAKELNRKERSKSGKKQQPQQKERNRNDENESEMNSIGGQNRTATTTDRENTPGLWRAEHLAGRALRCMREL